MIIIVFHYYNIYTLLCASTSCLISHDARIIPSSTERSCITIEHSYYKNNSDHLLSDGKITTWYDLSEKCTISI